MFSLFLLNIAKPFMKDTRSRWRAQHPLPAGEKTAFCVHGRCLREVLQKMTMLQKSPFPKETRDKKKSSGSS